MIIPRPLAGKTHVWRPATGDLSHDCPLRLAVTASSTGVQHLPHEIPEQVWATTRIAMTPILVSLQGFLQDAVPCRMHFSLMEYGDFGPRTWSKSFAAAPGALRHPPGAVETTVDKVTFSQWQIAVLVHSCGLLLTSASQHRVAVWQFPSSPDTTS